MASESQLRIFLAGRVAVEANGHVLDEARFPGRQGRLLFAYLVAERGRAVPRDELAEALWEDAPPATWDKALTVIASKLRGVLADSGIGSATALTVRSAVTGSNCPREPGSTYSLRRARRRTQRRRSRQATSARRGPRARLLPHSCSNPCCPATTEPGWRRSGVTSPRFASVR